MTVSANETREAHDLLAANRIAFMRHRRRALLALGERLLDFSDLCLLEPANLERELLERGRCDRQRRQKLRMSVALDHLRCHRRRLEIQSPADVCFDRGRQMCERADGAGQLADRYG